ncbi:hypothetical protein ACFVRU_19625, partial [Streptomyces sp. NPDC057927]
MPGPLLPALPSGPPPGTSPVPLPGAPSGAPSGVPPGLPAGLSSGWGAGGLSGLSPGPLLHVAGPDGPWATRGGERMADETIAVVGAGIVGLAT